MAARAMEQKGVVPDRCELNRQITADNSLLRELKSLVEKLIETAKNTINTIATVMETIRQNIIVFYYGLLSVRDRSKNAKEYVEQATRNYSDYKDIRSQIKVKAIERGELKKELAGLYVFAIGKRKELSIKNMELSEEIKELQFEEKSIMRVFDKADAAGMKGVEGEILKSEARIVELGAQEAKFTGTIGSEKEKFDELKAQAVDLEQDGLTDARLVLRPQMECEGCERIRKGAPDGRISFTKDQIAVRNADRILTENSTSKRYQEQKRKKEFENGFNQEKGR